jgi:hypothetical protein
VDGALKRCRITQKFVIKGKPIGRGIAAVPRLYPFPLLLLWVACSTRSSDDPLAQILRRIFLVPHFMCVTGELEDICQISPASIAETITIARCRMETRTSGQLEDRYTGAVESQTSKVPSSVFLGLALGSMAASAILKIMEKDDWALFVGQWAAPFLIMGNYNKMVKQHGSDSQSRWAA